MRGQRGFFPDVFFCVFTVFPQTALSCRGSGGVDLLREIVEAVADTLAPRRTAPLHSCSKTLTF